MLEATSVISIIKSQPRISPDLSRILQKIFMSSPVNTRVPKSCDHRSTVEIKVISLVRYVKPLAMSYAVMTGRPLHSNSKSIPYSLALTISFTNKLSRSMWPAS